MELLAQQPLEKANSTDASEDKAERGRGDSVADTGLHTAAGRLEEKEEEKEELGAKVQGLADTAAVRGKQDRRGISSVAPGVPKGAGAAAAPVDLSRETGTGEQQQARSSAQGEAKLPVVEVGGKEGNGPIAASNSATSRPGGGTLAGAISSFEDVGSGGALSLIHI